MKHYTFRAKGYCPRGIRFDTRGEVSLDDSSTESPSDVAVDTVRKLVPHALFTHLSLTPKRERKVKAG